MMFVFSRRALQRCIFDLDGVLDGVQLASLVDRLNRPGDDRIPAMWELVFLRALSSIATLRHEVELHSGRRPDFEFNLAQHGGGVPIVGDITSVSDAGLDAQNPVELLGDEVSRLAKKYKLNPNHFSRDVKGGRVGDYSKSKMALHLPSRGELLALIKEKIEPFIRGLAESGQSNGQLIYAADGVDFTIGYDQSQEGARGGWVSYDVAVSLTNNPVYRALKAKVKQLKASPEDAVRLVILCDGDCAAMRSSVFSQNYSAKQIAEEFLRQNSTVDLVLLASVESVSVNWRDSVLRMKYELVAAAPRFRSSRVNDDLLRRVTEVLNNAVRAVPIPQRELCNASRFCRERGYGIGMLGGWMGPKPLKISSRALHELLAGKMTLERFIEAHGWDEGGRSSLPNPFQRALSSGKMIASIEVENAGDKDDDWLAFEFSQPDSAISPFRVKP
jgi:hypothetical protein